jgi:predicted ABC-type ATPase
LSTAPLPPQIVVLAGTNGAGKSSVAGQALRQAGSEYFNPDEATRRFRERYPELPLEEANSRAWRLGRLLLHQVIERRLRFAFETTLGGRTFAGLLMKAANVGIPVRVWYVGLQSPELHIARVRARVARGGHDVSEARIRSRYHSSRTNLMTLLPHLAELQLHDNSREADPASGGRPAPMLVLHVKGGRIVDGCSLSDVPGWARPIVQTALNTYGPPEAERP